MISDVIINSNFHNVLTVKFEIWPNFESNKIIYKKPSTIERIESIFCISHSNYATFSIMEISEMLYPIVT